ncbi:hypothetical protein BDP27DRAFT_1428188 [Rhodocollybia butyracea]|uniref:CCHC-type domain-containing protein n=1 Tax=Rhodocollybia butyracea TaxID=206335 RepID=A0A9P5PE63_9AGAR|nr:hypothetical protein BDP27DRAFT_1428188 [Rhodocollybia butyracea]
MGSTSPPATAKCSSDWFAHKKKNGRISRCPIWGDIGEKQNAVDFEHSFLRAMRASNIEKKDFILEFQLYLTHGSPANDWYIAAAAAASDWDAFAAAFWVKFPAPKVQVRMPMEYEWILTELRLDEAKLLEHHPDTNNYMWKCNEQANWKDFTNTIKAVKKQEIEEGVEHQKLLEKTKAEVAAVQKGLWECIPPMPETPSKALGHSLAGMGFADNSRGRYGRDQRGGYAGRGNYRGRGGGPGQRNSTPLTSEKVATLAWNVALLPHHPNTSEGLQAYWEQLAAWAGRWGREAVINHEKPVLLKPGMSPVASGECFNCGMRGHQGQFCEAMGDQTLGFREREWRVLCGHNLPHSSGHSAQVNNVLDDDFDTWLSGGLGKGEGSTD